MLLPMGSAESPRTADGDEFRFRSGRPRLDLCSTVLWRQLRPVELLQRPEDLVRWLVGAGLWTNASTVTDSDLTATRALREAVCQLFQAHLQGRALHAVATVNEAAAAPDPSPQLSS